MSIEVDEGTIGKRARGPDLHYASTMPEGDVKAVLGILHGYADHVGRYQHVMGALAEHGIGSVAIDLRGHGRALGQRGYCAHFDEYLDDASELRRLVEDRARTRGSPPMFLFGHSFGGLVATASVIENASKLRGLVLSAPYFGLALKVPAAKVLAGKVMSRILPRIALTSGLSGKDMTHDKQKVKEYDEDPLVFTKATSRWFTEALDAQQQVLADAPRLALPLYVAFGTSDGVANISDAKKVFAAAGSRDKTWDQREGLFHEILNEPSWKDLLDAMARWILTHAESAPSSS